ncbi:hypothetical protein SS50377_20672 [Spironucleus salmonicida]|uniref:Uncharacterized protein n=1 Tax=Spironucleus salmonicida TaxID=348837 RepID=V6M0F1_9EUKA|nr:hypothetical protein SS50377_28745 [Spironucleus salmonicida]KAH0577321.1 hypothetical protein SS50377_20672 [Spironucleus salmonicida]|eukprot:EST49521.1 Hypothetical protein SS50377_10124 [Spironucleus salmonicida]
MGCGSQQIKSIPEVPVMMLKKRKTGLTHLQTEKINLFSEDLIDHLDLVELSPVYSNLTLSASIKSMELFSGQLSSSMKFQKDSRMSFQPILSLMSQIDFYDDLEE